MTTPYVSRSGRTVKKPVLYEPTERPEDDFADSDYDDDDSDEDIEDEEEEEEEEEDDEDADEKGNLKGFVVDSESEEEDCD